MKTRIEFNEMRAAIKHRTENGGTIAETTDEAGHGKIFWYSDDYSEFEIRREFRLPVRVMLYQ